MRWIYLNGELVQQETATVSALDRGLLYGYGLFETMRSYGGRVFRLEEHYQRLRDGAACLAMAVPLSLRDLNEAVDAVLERKKVPDAYVRLTLTAGASPVAGFPQPRAETQAADGLSSRSLPSRHGRCLQRCPP